MSQKILNIIESLKNEFNIPYQQLRDNLFGVETAMSQNDHQTFLNFGQSSGDIIRCEINHMFGCLNAERDISYNDLLNLLRHNFGTVRGSSTYLGIRTIEGRDFACLNSCLILSDKWEARDIADIINTLFNDMMMGMFLYKYNDAINDCIYIYHK